MSTLRERLIEAITKEASAFPGDNCDTEEDVCMDAHVHLAWSIEDKVMAVLASPERIADLTMSVFADVLREWSDEPAMLYDGPKSELVRRALETRLEIVGGVS